MLRRTTITALLLSAVPLAAFAGGFSPGLSDTARAELEAAGVNRYIGEFQPVASEDVGDGWTKHLFDSEAGDGPICISGTDYSVFTKIKDPRRVLIFFQGGGACWQDFYNCNVLAEDQAAPPDEVGIWSDSFDSGDFTGNNPLRDWSIVYLPYCDGSVFTGDNDVVDPAFPNGDIRYHRGLRNATAGIDLAQATFPNARRVLVAGSSAGGVGAAGFAPFLTRFAFGNRIRLSVFNDAGPVAINVNAVGDIQARAADWRFGQFFPESCTACDDQGQNTAIIKWRLENDRTVHEAFYSTDGDLTNRFFLGVFSQEDYRDLIVTEHGILHDAHKRRYKRFIRSGDASHTALQGDLYYEGQSNGIPLFRWMRNFLQRNILWVDVVEDFVPAAPQ